MMTNKNTTLRKLLHAALLSPICAVPLMSGIAATAAPQTHDQRAQSSHKTRQDNTSQNSSKQHTATQNHSSDQSHPTNQSHNSNQSWPANQNHNPNQSRPATDQHHGSNQSRSDNQNQNKNWQHRDNNKQDDSWHTSHGYTRNGSTWMWHGHDDAWWFNNGYQWNGTIWILLNHDTANYGPFETFTGVVTKVHGNHGFNLRAGAITYHVYGSQNLPSSLDIGDVVRVYGQRYGNNVIRNANYKIVRNR